jgi:hypothetical protein
LVVCLLATSPRRSPSIDRSIEGAALLRRHLHVQLLHVGVRGRRHADDQGAALASASAASTAARPLRTLRGSRSSRRPVLARHPSSSPSSRRSHRHARPSRHHLRRHTPSFVITVVIAHEACFGFDPLQNSAVYAGVAAYILALTLGAMKVVRDVM